MTPDEQILRQNYEAALAEIKRLNRKGDALEQKIDGSDRANGQMLEEIKRLSIEIEAFRQIISNYQGCLT
jgi:peptidoglycan hydrolase CwlO-like protein